MKLFLCLAVLAAVAGPCLAETPQARLHKVEMQVSALQQHLREHSSDGCMSPQVENGRLRLCNRPGAKGGLALVVSTVIEVEMLDTQAMGLCAVQYTFDAAAEEYIGIEMKCPRSITHEMMQRLSIQGHVDIFIQVIEYVTARYLQPT